MNAWIAGTMNTYQRQHPHPAGGFYVRNAPQSCGSCRMPRSSRWKRSLARVGGSRWNACSRLCTRNYALSRAPKPRPLNLVCVLKRVAGLNAAGLQNGVHLLEC